MRPIAVLVVLLTGVMLMPKPPEFKKPTAKVISYIRWMNTTDHEGNPLKVPWQWKPIGKSGGWISKSQAQNSPHLYKTPNQKFRSRSQHDITHKPGRNKA